MRECEAVTRVVTSVFNFVGAWRQNYVKFQEQRHTNIQLYTKVNQFAAVMV